MAAQTSTATGSGHPDWRKVGAIAAVVVVAMLALTARHSSAALNLDRGAFRMPTPPVDAVYNGRNTLISIIWLGALALTAFALAIRDYRRTGRTMALFVTLSAPMIIFPEVFVDVMGAVWYPVSQSDHAFTILGRQMGWFIVAGWFGYGALFAYLTYKVLEARVSTRDALAGLLRCLHRRDRLRGDPPEPRRHVPLLRQPAAHRAVEAAVVVDAVQRRRHLPGRVDRLPAPQRAARAGAGLAMFAITPASMGAVYGFIALPSWIVVNGDYGWWVTQVAGLATIAFGPGPGSADHADRARPRPVRRERAAPTRGRRRAASTRAGAGRLLTRAELAWRLGDISRPSRVAGTPRRRGGPSRHRRRRCGWGRATR